jgi:Zn-dependent protease
VDVESSFRLARVAGIEIGAHWSWLLVVALIVWSLAAGVFPTSNPGLADGAYIAMAAAAAVLFFASLTLHELGHAVQARRDGIAIEGITLWVFGGVARFRGQIPSAGAELRVAIAGPLVSLALGAAFLAVALALPLPAAVDGVAFWLGQINLYLLAFNLLPALPLDGGRVLRAALWARRRDFAAATRTAGALGRAFGQILIAAGLLLVIFVGAIGGLWLAFIGWFLLAAAEAEIQAAAARDALAGLTVAELMIRDPITVDAGASVQQLMDDAFYPTRHTAFPVTDRDEPVGLVSFRQALALDRDRWPTTPVAQIMIPASDARLDADTPLSEALARITDSELRRLLVCRGRRLEGLLSLTDVARVLEARGAESTAAMTGAGPAQERPPGRGIAPYDRVSGPPGLGCGTSGGSGRGGSGSVGCSRSGPGGLAGVSSGVGAAGTVGSSGTAGCAGSRGRDGTSNTVTRFAYARGRDRSRVSWFA